MTTDVISIAATAAAALLGLAFFLQKFVSSWKTTGTENSLVTLLHTELERMSSHNTKLMQEVGNLQEQVIKLNNELYKLTRENQNLHSEVVRLTQEVSALQKLIPGVPNGSTS